MQINDHTDNISKLGTHLETIKPLYVLLPRQNRGKPPNRYSPKGKVWYSITYYVSTHQLSPKCCALVQQMETIKIPTKVEEALSDPKWTEVMQIEMEALHKNKTWSVVTLPKGKKPVGSNGYTQTFGVDYQETFGPVAKMNTIRVLVSLAANLNWPLRQFDVKNTFLHGDLEEEVYMNFPPGYGVENSSGKVCRLWKALYGLKQSPRAWFGQFTQAMKKYGYRQGNSYHTLFIKCKDGKVTLLIIYMDDMIVSGDDIKEIERLHGYLSFEFEMKNLGGLKYFLRIEVARSRECIYLSQHKYMLDLLSETSMLSCKPVDTPIVQNHHLAIYQD